MSDSESGTTDLSEFDDLCRSNGEPEDANINLIRLVRKRVFLYKKADKRYNDRSLTETTWAQIAMELGWTKDETKEKWTRLRNNFCKVMARRKAKGPGVSAISGSNKPWIYEEEMAFLKKHMVRPRGLSYRIVPLASNSPAIKTDAESVAQDLSISPTARSEPTTQPRLTPRPDTDVHTILAHMKSMADEPGEPLVMWFKSLLPMLKSLSNEQVLTFQINTMQEIQRLTSPHQGHH